jgi:hypothetical protein
MNHNPWRSKTNLTLLGAGAVLCLGLAGCKANHQATNDAPSPAPTTPAPASADPGIDLNCVIGHLQNPPDSFHYVYKKTTTAGYSVDQEADFTPQTVDGFRLKPDGSQQPIHAVHSDPQAWQGALAGLTGISGMSSAVAIVHGSAATQRTTGGAPVNGYPTIHYAIDTARWDATTRQMLGNSVLGQGGFEKGDAWVTSEGCPVKLVLDAEMHKQDGSLLDRVHYEESMVKK